MKKLKLFVIAVLGVVSASMYVSAQDYKHPYGLIEKDGKVIDASGKHLGWVTADGIVKDEKGTKIAHLDSDGNLVDTKTGKKLGKAEKNGNYVYAFSKTADDKLTVSEPMNGTCEVKDGDGKVVVSVHENYKQIGACAYHCLSAKSKGQAMKMK